jgi:release factor glutamine methyltransferase
MATRLSHSESTTVKEALDGAVKFLDNHDIAGAHLDAELLLGYVMQRDRAWLKAHDDAELTPFQVADFESLISRRSEHVPVVHLTGVREFYGLDMEITPDVLTPRVETEQMVEWAIKYAPRDSRLIDIGTGSGAIAVAIAKHRPDLTIVGTDISEKELAVARRNAQRHNVKLELVESNLWSAFKRDEPIAGTNPLQGSSLFSTIVTNLPYLADDADLMPEVKREPAVALFGGPDGLDLYRRFLAGLPDHLNPDGYLFTECDPWQHEALIAEAAKFNLIPIEQGYFILGFQRQE